MKRLRALADALDRWLRKSDYEGVFTPPAPKPYRSYCMEHQDLKSASVCMRDYGHEGPHVKRGVSGYMDGTPPLTIQHNGVVHVTDWICGNPYYRRTGRPIRDVWTKCGLFYKTGSRHRRKEVTCVTCLVAHGVF